MGTGQFPICKQKWDLLRTSVAACTINRYIFCCIWNLISENGNLNRKFSKKVQYDPPMGCSPFSNLHFQMGVTLMGFAEDFGHGKNFWVKSWGWVMIQLFSNKPSTHEDGNGLSIALAFSYVLAMETALVQYIWCMHWLLWASVPTANVR